MLSWTQDSRLGPIPAQAGEPHSRDRGPDGHRAYPRAGGGTPCYQVLELLAMSKSRKQVEPRLPTLYKQNSVCINDFFRRFAERLDAEISDRRRVAPNQYN